MAVAGGLEKTKVRWTKLVELRIQVVNSQKYFSDILYSRFIYKLVILELLEQPQNFARLTTVVRNEDYAEKVFVVDAEASKGFFMGFLSPAG